MTDDEAGKLGGMVARSAYILGIATTLLENYRRVASREDQDACEWVMAAIESVFYLDEPLKPFSRKDDGA